METPSQFDLSAAPTSVDERRDSTRFPKDSGMDFATIIHPESCAGHVEVHDDSLGGLGILVSDPATFDLGVRLEMVYAGSHLSGTVRHVTKQPSGDYLVGIDCHEAD